MPIKKLVDRSSRSSVTGRLGILSDDETRHPRTPRFVRVVMDPVVADEGIRHANDLASEGGIGRNLLVADHRGGKNHFTLRVDGRAKSLAAEHSTIR